MLSACKCGGGGGDMAALLSPTQWHGGGMRQMRMAQEQGAMVVITC